MKIPTLETERLILRPISLDDAPYIQKWFNNWNIVRYLSANVPWPYPENGTETWLRDVALPRVEEGKDIIWVLTPKAGADKGCPIGAIHYLLEKKPHETDRGFWLAEPYHGQGLMSEAVRVTQDFYFLELGRDELIVNNALSNLASRRLKEKMGGVLIDVEDKPCARIEGPTEVWKITKGSWLAARKNL